MARKKVASEPVLRDWTAVDAALRDLKECQYALTELGVELDRRIDGLKDDYNKNAQPLQNRIKRLEGDVKEYVDAHRAELDGKSRTLVFGKVGYRASSKLMLAPAKVADPRRGAGSSDRTAQTQRPGGRTAEKKATEIR